MMTATTRSAELQSEILSLVRSYHAEAFPASQFVAGKSPIPVSGRVFDGDEMTMLVSSALEFWLTSGRFAHQFEREFAAFMGVRNVSLVNSGSSANLVAISCLTSPALGDRRLSSGDEVITVAAGFPTTINPIVQNQLVPVFVDVSIPTYNIAVDELEEAVSDRTRAVILAHTLGNPFDVDTVVAFARRHNLWLIEDTCDAVGALYRGKQVGSFGDLATVSFYPAHHMTMGEGGAVLSTKPLLKKLAESFRDWGRDCWCETGNDNTCGKRFDWQLGDLPCGYDHKYIYSHIGYNLKLTDMQAAIGLAQLKKLPGFIDCRRRNFGLLRDGLRDLEELFILPEATPHSSPSWFGFPLAIRDSSVISRDLVIKYLHSKSIHTRLLFGGNILRQPAYSDIKHRMIGRLPATDFVMENVFWVGVYPGLATCAIDYMIDVFHQLKTASLK